LLPGPPAADEQATAVDPAAPAVDAVPASLITDFTPSLIERIETPIEPPSVSVVPPLDARPDPTAVAAVETPVAVSPPALIAKVDVASAGDRSDQVLSYALLLAGVLGIGTLYVWLRREAQLRLNARFAEQMALLPIVEPPAEMENEVDNYFAELVGNEIEIIEEPLVLPDQLDLHGKAVGQQRLIIHPAQPLAGPHFTSTPAPVREAVSSSAGGKIPSSTREVSPRPTQPVASASSGIECEAGLLERVLMRMQHEGRR
jgi:hypothetical protein